MEEYKGLKLLSYEVDINIENRIKEELAFRKNKYLSIMTGFYINPMFKGEPLRRGISKDDYEIFCNIIAPIRTLCEDINDKSKEITSISLQIPKIAKSAVINRLTVNEIQSTNEIEGVQSTKEEIRSSIDKSSSREVNRHVRIIESYINILKSDVGDFTDIKDLRSIYDDLFRDSRTVESYVEGDLFRQEPIYITKAGKLIHTGVAPSKIEESLQRAIDIVNRRDIPYLVKMSIFHYIFEYIHPFYDGNGRLGRYLMSAYLKRKLDIFTAISVSYSINQNKSKYEKLFLDMTEKRNYAEITGFVQGLLELVYEGQKSIESLLKISLAKMSRIDTTIKSMLKDNKLGSLEAKILEIYSKVYVFNEHEKIRDNDIIELLCEMGHKKEGINGVKMAIQSLEQNGYLMAIKQRPKIHELSDKIKIDLE